MSDGGAPITLGTVKAVAATPKALMVSFIAFEDDIDLTPIEDDEAFWVPLSCIHDDSEVYAEALEGTLIVKAWWASKQGLIE